MESKEQQQINDILEIVTFMRDNAVNKVEFDELKKTVHHIQAVMVTKEYLDDKLADLKGDLTLLIRKEDTKLKTLVTVLETHNVLNPEDKRHFFSLEPFPEIVM